MKAIAPISPNSLLKTPPNIEKFQNTPNPDAVHRVGPLSFRRRKKYFGGFGIFVTPINLVGSPPMDPNTNKTLSLFRDNYKNGITPIVPYSGPYRICKPFLRFMLLPLLLSLWQGLFCITYHKLINR